MLGKRVPALDSQPEIGTLPLRSQKIREESLRGEIMKTLLGFSRIVDYVTEIVGKSVSWLILVAVLVSAGNAVVRKVFNTSSNAWLEAQWYLFGAAFMLAAAYTLRQNEHIRIDIVYGSLSRRVQHWIDLIGHCLFLMPFVLLMVYDLVPYVRTSFLSGEVSSSAGGLIIWPGKALLLAGFFLLALQGISEIIKKIAVMRGDMDDPTPYVPTHAPLDVETPAGEAR
ncbi:TRAP-type mannitol/chloroaromatic compound transport system permease small subunit [Rhizobium sp. ERR 1071]|nr:TRAP-type mannitol/chloroaromatic compound transport system permease small subunit [Rhizobium sp. ERR1071]